MVPGSDMNMTWSSFLAYYQKIARDVSHLAAYDYARNRWVDSAEALTSDGAFRLVVLTMRDGFKIRIEIVPETRHVLTIDRESVDSPRLWQALLRTPVDGAQLEVLKLLKQRLPVRASLPQISSALERLAKDCRQLADRLKAGRLAGKGSLE